MQVVAAIPKLALNRKLELGLSSGDCPPELICPISYAGAILAFQGVGGCIRCRRQPLN